MEQVLGSMLPCAAADFNMLAENFLCAIETDVICKTYAIFSRQILVLINLKKLCYKNINHVHLEPSHCFPHGFHFDLIALT